LHPDEGGVEGGSAARACLYGKRGKAGAGYELLRSATTAYLTGVARTPISPLALIRLGIGLREIDRPVAMVETLP
jgi:hypothetical protein